MLNKILILFRFFGKVLVVCLLGNMVMGVGFFGGFLLVGRLEGLFRFRFLSEGFC